MKKIIFTEEQQQQILNMYQIDYLGSQKIATKMGVSKSVILNFLKEKGINVSNRGCHKYYADYNKFEIIDSPEKAYWLGFIAADGCVYIRPQNATIRINIHQKDKEILEKFKIFMNSNVNITEHIQTEGFSNNTPMVAIAFNSKKMAEDFIKHGVPNKKSLILKPPMIEEQYFLPYILGYFDGDGSIYKASQYNNYGLNIEGTKEVLEWINSILHISDRLEKRNPEDDKNNYYIRCGGTTKPYEIMKKLYNSVDVHLERKYQIFKELEKVVLSRNTK